MWTEEAKAGFLPHVEETIEFLAHEPYPPYPATPTTSPTPPVDSQYAMEATPAPSPGPGPGPGFQPYGAVPSASTSPAAKRRKVDSISESRYDELGNLILPSPDIVVPVKESKRERERREKREARERIARNGSYGDEDDEGSGEMGAGSRAPAKQKEEKKEADTETGWTKDQQTKVGNLATVSRPVKPSEFWLNLVRSYFRAHMKDATTLYQEILNQIMSHRDEKRYTFFSHGLLNDRSLLMLTCLAILPAVGCLGRSSCVYLRFKIDPTSTWPSTTHYLSKSF